MSVSDHRLRRLLDDALARTPVEMISPLARADVVRRLRDAIDGDWVVFGGKPVIGRVDERSFRLRLRLKYRNSFQTFLFGKIMEDGRSTRLRCRVGMHPIAAAVMALWLIAVVGLLVAALSSMDSDPAAGLFLAVPGAMVAFGVALVWLGRWLARDERRRLIAFLEQTLGALDRSPA